MSVKLYCIFSKDDSLEVIVNSQFNLREIHEKWLDRGQIRPCLLHIGYDRPVDDDLFNFFLDSKKYIYATPSFYYSFPEKIEFSKNTYYQLNNMDLKVLISGWFQTEINEEEIDIKKINKIELTQSPDNNSIIDKKISAILAEYNFINHQEFLDKEKNNSSDPQILEIQKKIFLSCRDSFSSFDDFLKITPFWLKQKSITELFFSVRIENCFTSRKINTLNDLSGFSKNDLIEWKNFGSKSMFLLIDRIESLILSNSSNFDSSILHNTKENQFSDHEGKKYSYENFTQWLFRLKVSESTKKKYNRAVQQISLFLKENGHIDSSLLDLETSEDVKNKIDIYFSDAQNFAQNKKGNNMWSAAGNKLIEYFIYKEKKKKIKKAIDVNYEDLFSEYKSYMDSILSDKETEILIQRSGFVGSSRTLEDIGKDSSVTRERIRQIEKRANLKIMKVYPEWCKKLRKECEHLYDKYSSQNYPLNLRYISNSDPYFKGVDEKYELFEYILENFLPNKFFLIDFNGDKFLAKCKQLDFNKLIKSLKYKFKNLDSTSFENFINKELSIYSISMMKDLILDHFSSYGSTSGFKIRLIQLLEERGEPGHFKELFELYNDKYPETEKARDIEAKLNHYTDVFFCYGRGIWGLKEHLNIDVNEQFRMSNLVESFILNNPNGEHYQWSSEDLVKKNNLNVNEYELNIILQINAKKIHYLGRNVWSASESDRLEFFDLAVQILKTSLRPMNLKEIKEKINERRSALSVAQLHLKSPLIMIDKGFYGLETFTPEQKQLTTEQKKKNENSNRIKIPTDTTTITNEYGRSFNPGSWNPFFEVLTEYYLEYQNTSSIVNTTIYKNTKIGNWIGRQRRLYYKNELPAEWVIKLETSFHDWDWKRNNRSTENWYEKYEILKNYIEEYGNSDIKWDTIYKEIKLGEWAKSIKHQFIHKKLDEEKYSLIEEIYPEWKDLKAEQKYYKWYKNFELLKQYLEEYKITNINNIKVNTIFKDVKLGKWISKQRSMYNINKLPSEKIISLESLDNWTWGEIRGPGFNESSWDDKLQILLDYYNEFQTLKLRRGKKYKGIDLSVWVSNQKQNFLRNNLSQDRINKINDTFPEWVWTKTT